MSAKNCSVAVLSLLVLLPPNAASQSPDTPSELCRQSAQNNHSDSHQHEPAEPIGGWENLIERCELHLSEFQALYASPSQLYKIIQCDWPSEIAVLTQPREKLLCLYRTQRSVCEPVSCRHLTGRHCCKHCVQTLCHLETSAVALLRHLQST